MQHNDLPSILDDATILRVIEIAASHPIQGRYPRVEACMALSLLISPGLMFAECTDCIIVVMDCIDMGVMRGVLISSERQYSVLSTIPQFCSRTFLV